MVEIGYSLFSEEHPPHDLVRDARRAEEVGFAFALISDHYHPWIDRQNHSSFVWSVLGGIAQHTQRLTLGTGVSCPMMRLHPAIIAQAAATAAAMLPGRFVLGVGTGENLNEHILGQHWPPAGVRWAMLVREEDVAKTVVCGLDPERHMAAIRDFADAGFDHVYVHQIGPDQEGFFRFYAGEVLPHFRERGWPHKAWPEVGGGCSPASWLGFGGGHRHTRGP